MTFFNVPSPHMPRILWTLCWASLFHFFRFFLQSVLSFVTCCSMWSSMVWLLTGRNLGPTWEFLSPNWMWLKWIVPKQMTAWWPCLTFGSGLGTATKQELIDALRKTTKTMQSWLTHPYMSSLYIHYINSEIPHAYIAFCLFWQSLEPYTSLFVLYNVNKYYLRAALYCMTKECWFVIQTSEQGDYCSADDTHKGQINA